MSDIYDNLRKSDPLTKQLVDFGLSQLEAKIYLFLLNRKPQSVVEIARNLDIPRTSIYDNTQRLIEKGVVERVAAYKSHKLRAVPLEFFQTVIDKEKTKVAQLESSLKELQTNLAQSLNPHTATEVRYYHGASGFKQMMWNALSAKMGHLGYSEMGRVDIVGKKFLDHWMQEMISRGIKDRVIINPKPESLKHLLPLDTNTFRLKYQNTRVIDTKTLYISGDTTIYNNVFAVAWWRQGEVVGVEIENPELVKTQKSIFEILWKIAKPVASSLKKSKN